MMKKEEFTMSITLNKQELYDLLSAIKAPDDQILGIYVNPKKTFSFVTLIREEGLVLVMSIVDAQNVHQIQSPYPVLVNDENLTEALTNYLTTEEHWGRLTYEGFGFLKVLNQLDPDQVTIHQLKGKKLIFKDCQMKDTLPFFFSVQSLKPLLKLGLIDYQSKPGQPDQIKLTYTGKALVEREVLTAYEGAWRGRPPFDWERMGFNKAFLARHYIFEKDVAYQENRYKLVKALEETLDKEKQKQFYQDLEKLDDDYQTLTKYDLLNFATSYGSPLTRYSFEEDALLPPEELTEQILTQEQLTQLEALVLSLLPKGVRFLNTRLSRQEDKVHLYFTSFPPYFDDLILPLELIHQGWPTVQVFLEEKLPALTNRNKYPLCYADYLLLGVVKASQSQNTRLLISEDLLSSRFDEVPRDQADQFFGQYQTQTGKIYPLFFGQGMIDRLRSGYLRKCYSVTPTVYGHHVLGLSPLGEALLSLAPLDYLDLAAEQLPQINWWRLDLRDTFYWNNNLDSSYSFIKRLKKRRQAYLALEQLTDDDQKASQLAELREQIAKNWLTFKEKIDRQSTSSSSQFRLQPPSLEAVNCFVFDGQPLPALINRID